MMTVAVVGVRCKLLMPVRNRLSQCESPFECSIVFALGKPARDSHGKESIDGEPKTFVGVLEWMIRFVYGV